MEFPVYFPLNQPVEISWMLLGTSYPPGRWNAAEMLWSRGLLRLPGCFLPQKGVMSLIYIYIYIYISIYICIHYALDHIFYRWCIYIYVCIYIHICHINIYIQIHLHIHTYIYIYLSYKYIWSLCVCAIYVHQSSFRHLSKHRRTFNDSPTPRTFNGLGPLLRIQDDQVHQVADI